MQFLVEKFLNQSLIKKISMNHWRVGIFLSSMFERILFISVFSSCALLWFPKCLFHSQWIIRCRPFEKLNAEVVNSQRLIGKKALHAVFWWFFPEKRNQLMKVYHFRKWSSLYLVTAPMDSPLRDNQRKICFNRFFFFYISFAVWQTRLVEK